VTKGTKQQTSKGWLAGETFGERLATLKGELSYHELARRMQKAGLKVTAQALHKYIAGAGGVSEENLKGIAKFFGVSPAHLYFGEIGESEDALTPEARLVAKAWMLVPDRFRPELTRDILRIAFAYADQEDEAFRSSLKKMLEQLTTV